MKLCQSDTDKKIDLLNKIYFSNSNLALNPHTIASPYCTPTEKLCKQFDLSCSRYSSLLLG